MKKNAMFLIVIALVLCVIAIQLFVPQTIKADGTISTFGKDRSAKDENETLA